MFMVVTIALPARYAQRLEEFVTETGVDHDQAAREILEWALGFLKTSEECAAHGKGRRRPYACMAHDWNYLRTAIQMAGGFEG